MVKYGWLHILLIVFAFSCKKSGERTCMKSFGAETIREVPLDSVNEFRLYKNITYHVFQDTLRKLIIKGGENVVDLIEVTHSENVLSVTNKNKCNFLRDFDKKIVVEIHYPFYHRFYSEAEDSLIFHGTIVSDYLYVEQVEGGGGVRLDVDAGILVMVASNGVGNYLVSGQADYADLRVQMNASGNAVNLKAPVLEIDNNSTADLLVNADSAEVSVLIRGTGNVVYTGVPDTLTVTKKGDGDVIGG